MNGDPVAPLTKEKVIHGDGWIGDGRTLCGVVEEGDQSVGIQPPHIARDGERVNCLDCRRAILHIYISFTINGKRR